MQKRKENINPNLKPRVQLARQALDKEPGEERAVLR